VQNKPMKKYLSIILFLVCVFPIFGQDSQYQLGADSKRQEGVPQGTVARFLFESKFYGNFRYYYLYVPAQYDPKTPAALMIFQDGYAYIREDGDFRAGIVFDNLIAKKQIPVTIGLFVNPGHSSKDFPEIFFRSSNRSDEYDEMSDRYDKFLLNELIPEIKKHYKISDDRKMHAIGGLSSGGIASFTAAWQRADYFSKVMSHVGSFTDIKGGHEYPNLIRKGSKKDIKVFLQDGTGDLDNIHGNWWLANLEMEASLKFKGYEYKFEKGTGGHSGKHGGAILPESLVWLWSDAVSK
jgi:enterochelin esterase-like enzyme